MGMKSKTPSTIAADTRRLPPVTSTGRPAAVMSVHMRKSFQNACKFGVTLTNDLPYKVTDLTFRLTAVIKGNVPFDTQTKSFSQLRPSDQQYREITFQGVECDEIDRIEVSDPGRCTVDTLNRFNSNAGDCAKFSDMASGGVVSVVKKK
jgi:hypothetical protein